MILPKYIETILYILDKNGFEGFVVGGSVRDFVMGNLPHDYDITTSALPDETKKCFENFKTIDTGLKHGTVSVLSDNNIVEITTYRIDGDYKDGRHPENVTFSPSLDEDLKRRDFTVNAMAYSKKTGVYDIFGGKEDVKNKIIRCVGEPDKRFNEDALRILRALRFSSVLGFEIEEETKKSIIKNIKLLNAVSKERIFEELKKLITGKNAEVVFKEFSKELEFIIDCDNAKNFKKLSLCSSLALIFKTEDMAYNSLKNLKADNKTINMVTNLVKYKDFSTDYKSLKKLASVTNEEFLTEFGIFKGLENEVSKVLTSGECYSLKGLKIKGNHLKDLGFKGEEIKKVLEFLLDKVIENNELNDYNTLLELIEK